MGFTRHAERFSNATNIPYHDFLHLLLLRLDKVVNDGIKEYTANTDTAPEKLHEIEGFAEDDGNTDDDNNTLGRVGHRLGDSILFSRGRRDIRDSCESEDKVM